MAGQKAGEKVSVDVGGRQLALSNLHKVLYPETGFTKGEVIDYYARVAPVMLPHLAQRAVTFSRWPDGVGGKAFYEKNAPRHAPAWVRKATLPSPGSGMNRDTIDYVVIDDLPTLVWAANLAALELHVPQWKVDADGQPLPADLLVFDLDPGAPATVVECAQVARAAARAPRERRPHRVRQDLRLEGHAAHGPHRGRRPRGHQHVREAARGRARGGAPRPSSSAGWPRTHEAARSSSTGPRTTPRRRPWRRTRCAREQRPTVSTPLRWDEVETGRRASSSSPPRTSSAGSRRTAT